MMLVVGLTGGIATGKSEVSRILREFGAIVIDADRVGHQAYLPDSPAWQEVVDTFGEEVFLPTGEIDRKRLGAIVFNDPAARQKLNSIMHPKMAQMIGEDIDRLRREGTEVVVVEAALLLEAHWDYLVDEVWITHSSEEAMAQRLRQRNNLSEEEIMSRIRAQPPFEERAQRADVVIDNSGNVAELQKEMEALWNGRVKGKVG